MIVGGLVLAALGAVATAPAASAEPVACTAEYAEALTDEYYLYYADYPYSWYAREQTAQYAACVVR